jgi:hypothetical protein
MNERIQELERQAKQYANSMYPSGLDIPKWGPAYHEKFAELIVQECIDKIETYRIPVGNSAAGEMACKWTYDALKEIRDEIKEHFGDKND